MVVWTNADGTTIEWPDGACRPVPSLMGYKAISVSSPLAGHAQRLEAGAAGQLTFDHPTDYTAPAKIREVVKNHSSFGAMLNAVIEFE